MPIIIAPMIPIVVSSFSMSFGFHRRSCKYRGHCCTQSKARFYNELSFEHKNRLISFPHLVQI